MKYLLFKFYFCLGILLTTIVVCSLLGWPKTSQQYDTEVIGANSAPYVSGYSDPSTNAADRWHRAFYKLYADYKILEEAYNRLQQEGYDAYFNQKISDNFTLRITEYTPTDNTSFVQKITIGEWIAPIYINRVVEKIVTQNITIEKVVTQNITLEQLRPFNHISELREWVNKWEYDPNPNWINTSPSTITFDTQSNDCDKYSRQMVVSGVRDGYLMGLVVDAGKGHMIVCALIGNNLHFIEPQNKTIYNVLNDSYWRLDEPNK